MKENIILTAFMTVPMLAMAQNSGQQPTGEQVVLTTSFDHKGTIGNNPPKGPIQPPYVTLDDHTLYIWSQHGGYTLTLLDDNDTVVYQTYVNAGTQMVSLPTTLSGIYTLQLSDDTFLFTGMIDLE